MIVVQRQPKLLEIIAALGPPRGFASRLHRWQQQCDQDRDDRNDDQQFDERETSMRHDGILFGRGARCPRPQDCRRWQNFDRP